MNIIDTVYNNIIDYINTDYNYEDRDSYENFVYYTQTQIDDIYELIEEDLMLLSKKMKADFIKEYNKRVDILLSNPDDYQIVDVNFDSILENVEDIRNFELDFKRNFGSIYPDLKYIPAAGMEKIINRYINNVESSYKKQIEYINLIKSDFANLMLALEKDNLDDYLKYSS